MEENIKITVIKEKDKVTTIVEKEPVEGQSTSSKILINKDCINLQIQ